MNFAQTVKFGKEYIICKGICVCFVGKQMLETVQGEDWEKCWLVNSTTPLRFSFLNMLMAHLHVFLPQTVG